MLHQQFKLQSVAWMNRNADAGPCFDLLVVDQIRAGDRVNQLAGHLGGVLDRVEFGQ
ncbi:hypothetical protein SDC9_202591 [bioreactor metagenome]|uniref:Uncharacterized protein n=1 Tax=bioreactor metagenome TaxID=1076179 RepID=A0A645J618_9ZZZZ